jgi:hypothetical protein
MSETTAVWIFIIFAVVSFALQDGPLIVASMRHAWRGIRWVTSTSWHWGATVPWDVSFGLGWLGMVQLSEYAIGLACLGFVCFGLFSRLCHRQFKENGILIKSFGSAVIVLLFYGMLILTIANKGDRPWSPMLNLIDGRLASHVPLPPGPEPLSLRVSLPSGMTLARTSKATWDAVRQERADALQHPRTPIPGPAPTPEEALHKMPNKDLREYTLSFANNMRDFDAKFAPQFPPALQIPVPTDEEGRQKWLQERQVRMFQEQQQERNQERTYDTEFKKQFWGKAITLREELLLRLKKSGITPPELPRVGQRAAVQWVFDEGRFLEGGGVANAANELELLARALPSE